MVEDFQDLGNRCQVVRDTKAINQVAGCRWGPIEKQACDKKLGRPMADKADCIEAITKHGIISLIWPGVIFMTAEWDDEAS